ncbi:type II secretion system protein [Sulfuricurvum sp.]|uniref:type II secretion system protein n=1 Tax=Sulfuricurvum sp. TaxID=2025608 RepID=UPI002625B4B4|nr:type II secretion system protein [Sulfuricurvum sp.]MDD2838510.1 type II secretion system protein [Sulfuricurvum sp.]MDD3597422.1 type II secretion system protein [Sulfuricurvum sp.]
MKKAGFTMIELVFVIVILGILASIAIPRMSATRLDAQITKGRSDVASVRSAIISERQSRMLQGQTNYITTLSKNAVFDGNGSSTLLMYPMTSSTKDGHWSNGGGNTYVYHLEGGSNTFTYTQANGTFMCTSGTYCSKLAE